MKKLVLVSLSLIISCKPQPSQRSGVADTYEFPINQNSPQWASLSDKEKLEICQIPEEVLTEMSTEVLFMTCMDYPLLTNIIAEGDIEVGTKNVIREFNGLAELARREDGASVMVDFYQNFYLVEHKGTLFEEAQESMSLLILHRLLSQELFLEQLYETEKRDLVSKCMENYLVCNTQDLNRGLNTESLCLIIGRTLVLANYLPFKNDVDKHQELQTFLRQGWYDSTPLDSMILQHARRYVGRVQPRF